MKIAKIRADSEGQPQATRVRSRIIPSARAEQLEAIGKAFGDVEKPIGIADDSLILDYDVRGNVVFYTMQRLARRTMR